MREYEVTVVLKSEIDDEARNELIERVKGWLTHGEGEAAEPTIEQWGHRGLAYPIDKQTDGYYVYYEATLDPTRVVEIERNMQYVDDILRHLVVRKA